MNAVQRGPSTGNHLGKLEGIFRPLHVENPSHAMVAARQNSFAHDVHSAVPAHTHTRAHMGTHHMSHTHTHTHTHITCHK